MKLSRLFLGMALLLGTMALPASAQQQYEIYYQSETDETIQLSVMVYDVKEKQAANYACIYAVQALIFDGIDGSKRRRIPYVHNEKESFEKHSAYYHNIFDNSEYQSFIIASSIKEKGKTQDKKKYYLVNVNVSVKSLKESLIQHNVIRRFGV